MSKSILISIQPQWVEKFINKKDLKNEIWVDINGYENLYAVSNYGRILSNSRRRTKGGLLSPQMSKSGYYMQMLYKNGKAKLHRINRLVAENFIENPNKLSQVNHLDGNKLNNNVKNLEWCTQSENQLHAYRLGLQKVTEKQKQVARKFCIENKSKKVAQYDTDNNLINKYNSISEASRETGISTACISRACNFIRNKANGYIWRFI